MWEGSWSMSIDLPDYGGHTFAHDPDLTKAGGRLRHQDPVGGAVSLPSSPGRTKLSTTTKKASPSSRQVTNFR